LTAPSVVDAGFLLAVIADPFQPKWHQRSGEIATVDSRY
jgi:hypothetical protein